MLLREKDRERGVKIGQFLNLRGHTHILIEPQIICSKRR